MSLVRVAAAQVLLALERRDATLAAAVDRARAGLTDPRDRALLVELAAGVQRWQQALDARLASASQRDVSTLDPPVRAVLRLGAYQICHLERIPAHAVVNESVETVRRLGAPRAAGLVNAVLRALLRQDHGRALPDRPPAGAGRDAQIDYLAVTLSHPRWLVRRWIDRYGFEAAETWCHFNNQAPYVTVRPRAGQLRDVLLSELRADGIEAEVAPYAPDAIQLPPGGLGRMGAAAASAVTIQDEGSQLVATFAGCRPGERVIDLCAAPGGKTTALAGDLALGQERSGSQLFASDHRLSRVRLLTRTLRDRGLSVPVLALDARRALPFDAVFDCVLLDAPCSGLGTLRRDPDLKWHRTEADLTRFAEAQRHMIRAAAAIVRPGGRLVYATCSTEPDENDAVIADFLADTPAFARTGAPPACPTAVVEHDGTLRTTAFAHGLDGYYAVRLVRRGAA